MDLPFDENIPDDRYLDGHDDDAQDLDATSHHLVEFTDPTCEKCGGSGYVAEGDGSLMDRNTICLCVIRGRLKAAQDSRIESLFGAGGAKMTIASYQHGDNPDNKLARRSAITYVNEFPKFRDAGAGFALHGPPGSGKTHLATGTLIALIRRWDINPYSISVPEMLRLARKRFDDPTATDVIDRAMFADVYLLDDIGSEYHRAGSEGMSWVDEQLFMILNHRLTHGLPTIYTTNLNQRELRDRLDGRVARRLDTATVGKISMHTVITAHKASNQELRNLLMGT